MIDNLGLSPNQKKLVLISAIGAIIQVIALCFLDEDRKYLLIFAFICTTIINSIMYNKLFSV